MKNDCYDILMKSKAIDSLNFKRYRYVSKIYSKWNIYDSSNYRFRFNCINRIPQFTPCNFTKNEKDKNSMVKLGNGKRLL